MGSNISSTAINLSQGSFINSDNPFDIALGGKGWLQVNYNGAKYFTRDGSFKRDADGFLVNDSGAYLEVANANNLIQNADGTYNINRNVPTDKLLPTTSLSPIKLPNNVILPALATSKVKLETNLNDSNVIEKSSLAKSSSDFSALYDKNKQNMKIRNGDSLVFGFGNSATYDHNLITSDFCLHDDKKDGKDVNIDFTINGKKIKLTLPDRSSKQDIQNALHKELTNNGIQNEISNNGIKISDPSHIIISSNDKIIPNTAIAKLSYKSTPQNSYEFATIDDFDKILQNLADVAYPNDANVKFQNGKIQIFNNNETKTLHSYILKTESSTMLLLQILQK